MILAGLEKYSRDQQLRPSCPQLDVEFVDVGLKYCSTETVKQGRQCSLDHVLYQQPSLLDGDTIVVSIRGLWAFLAVSSFLKPNTSPMIPLGFGTGHP